MKTQATIASAWLRTKVPRRWDEAPFAAVVVSSAGPVLADDSRRHQNAPLEIDLRRHSPLAPVGFSFAMRTIKSRISPRRGRRAGRDLQRQNRWKSLRCQPIRVSGLTITERSPLEQTRPQCQTAASRVRLWLGFLFTFLIVGQLLSKTQVLGYQRRSRPEVDLQEGDEAGKPKPSQIQREL
jgi:hypothetical protein